ncbi:MAG: VanZ family protein [Deltaproteobacteria bacterium]|nr:VanZ family protein [Candidatus Tharpellaceae bacterium]
MTDHKMTPSLITWYVLPLAAYCALIFYLSSQADVDLPSIIPQSDKLLHLAEYAVLGFLAYRFFQRLLPEKSAVFVVMVAFLFALIYGLSDEFHQSFVSGRDSSCFDILADGAGGYLGARVTMLILGKGRREEQ